MLRVPPLMEVSITCPSAPLGSVKIIQSSYDGFKIIEKLFGLVELPTNPSSIS